MSLVRGTDSVSTIKTTQPAMLSGKRMIAHTSYEKRRPNPSIACDVINAEDAAVLRAMKHGSNTRRR